MKKVSIRYGKRTILKNLDWTVKNGEHWALGGQNGAGKSTLINVITGQLGCEKGNSHIFDKNWMLIS